MKFTLINCVGILLLANSALAAYDPDEVTGLPTLNWTINFKHYSGYLDIGDGKHFHYWFVQSQKNATTDPLVLWLNGGPGCSAMEGILDEHGPFLVRNGQLVDNPYSWNKVANILYLESPAGVGFSYSDDKIYDTDDDKTSLDNYVAIQEFLKKFPEYSNNDFYITGESYAGIYIPTLAVRVLDGLTTFPINFKGFAIGNGLLSYELNDNSLLFYGYYHGLFGYKLWNELVHLCCSNISDPMSCNFHDPGEECYYKVQEANDVMETNSLLNIYNIYNPCLHPNESSVTQSHHSPLTVAKQNLFRNLKKQNKVLSKVGDDPPCIDSSVLTHFINRDDLRHSLHIPQDLPEWTICNPDVNSVYGRIYQTVKPQFQHLSGLRNMVYYGDIDMACNFMGAQWFIEDLGRTVITEYAAWVNDGNIAGFAKKYENLQFVTIKGSGHTVPEYKPVEAFAMFKKYINNEDF